MTSSRRTHRCRRSTTASFSETRHNAGSSSEPSGPVLTRMISRPDRKTQTLRPADSGQQTRSSRSWWVPFVKSNFYPKGVIHSTSLVQLCQSSLCRGYSAFRTCFIWPKVATPQSLVEKIKDFKDYIDLLKNELLQFKIRC